MVGYFSWLEIAVGSKWSYLSVMEYIFWVGLEECCYSTTIYQAIYGCIWWMLLTCVPVCMYTSGNITICMASDDLWNKVLWMTTKASTTLRRIVSHGSIG